ncbi:hypothetical protein GCM10017744_001640 [Streptomyces antimycoticus]|uniref:Uncharacterized protein n=1 Tax=Streptomyces antimycoticus TaxID=68175 RepID=A0A4D4KR34_9ACTN|nr:hypothetical protein SANT12839_098000 [Streptomyces antimycoticus]
MPRGDAGWMPGAAEGEGVVTVRTAAVNLAGDFIRSGAATAMFPTAFPSGPRAPISWATSRGYVSRIGHRRPRPAAWVHT